MTKPKPDTEIILITHQELEDYAKGWQNGTVQEQNFCEYLKKIHKSKAKEVIADLSRLTISIDLKDVDLGNVIVGKRDGKNTQFFNCNLTNTILRSNASMEGLEFTGCKEMKGAMLQGNLDGVVFGLGSDISHINLREAYNIDKCIINPQCTVSNVELGFPDMEAFEDYISAQLKDQKINQVSANAHKTETQHRRANAPESPDYERLRETPKSPDITGGLPSILNAVWSMTGGLVNAVGSVVASGTKALWKGATTNATIKTQAPENEVELHKSAIELIKNSNPVFSPSSKELNASNLFLVTDDMVKEWADLYKGGRQR